MQGIWAISNPYELAVVCFECKNQIQNQSEESSDVAAGVVSSVRTDEIQDRWLELGIVTEIKWESLTKTISLRSCGIEEIEKRHKR